VGKGAREQAGQGLSRIAIHTIKALIFLWQWVGSYLSWGRKGQKLETAAPGPDTSHLHPEECFDRMEAGRAGGSVLTGTSLAPKALVRSKQLRDSGAEGIKADCVDLRLSQPRIWSSRIKRYPARQIGNLVNMSNF
jgi:hypothetical protein